MVKKVLCFLMVVSLVCLPCFSVTTYAASASCSDSRINDILELSGLKNIPATKFRIVSLQVNSSNRQSTIQKDMAIQAMVVNNEQVEMTTIIPYKVTASGELVNSFEYANSSAQMRNTDLTTSNFADASVTVKTYFARYPSPMNATTFFRHAGIEAYWSSNNATVEVDRLYVLYESAGELYAYPECISQPNCKVQDYYFIGSYIDEEFPPEGRLYVSPEAPMPTNRVLCFTDFMFHGGNVYVQLEYYVNGEFEEDHHSYDIYYLNDY